MKAARRRAWVTGAIVVIVGGVGLAAILDESGDAAPSPVVLNLPEGRVRVEVLNGGGVAGMARTATERLRESGLDVVDFGNALPFDPERPSRVIDRVGRPELASAVAGALGIDNVLSEPDPNLYVDVTVVLGGEWRSPEARASTDGAASAHAWWDPRGWLSR